VTHEIIILNYLLVHKMSQLNWHHSKTIALIILSLFRGVLLDCQM